MVDEAVLPQHVAAVARGARCTECPLYGCKQGPVMPAVRQGAPITVVSESPGNTEVEEGRLLTGSPGEMVYEALLPAGYGRNDVSVTAAILCRPPGGHMLDYAALLKQQHAKAVARAKELGLTPPPLITPQLCCTPRLHRDIVESGSRVVLALGSEGLKACAQQMQLPMAPTKVPPGTPRVAPLKKQHGAPVVAKDGRILMSTLHPAFVIFGANTRYIPVIKADITRAATMAKRGGVIDWQEPEFILKPSIDTCRNVLRILKESKTLITVDIETDGIITQTARIRCIGLGGVVNGRELIIVVPLRHMDGRSWWLPGDEHRLSHDLTDLLESNPLSGHNLLFDTAVLLNRGLLKNRGKTWVDTMTGHHDTNQSELPHDLGFVATRCFEAPRWKDDADHKNVEGVDDYWLHLYCAKDVLGEMRLVNPLLTAIDEQGTIGAYRTDTQLNPVARDMGELGLNVNEERRRAFFDILDRVVQEKVIELRRVTGIPDFNPNAFKQVARFLYVTKGLSPPYATDGREWAELEDDEEVELDTDDPEVIVAKAATNELSLLRLLELGVDKHTEQFIEAQLQYRGLQKCKATYMGLKYEEEKGVKRLVDTHRKKGFLQTESWGPGLENLSIIHPSWKLHITPTGRWATSPNVQNWPERVVFDVTKYRAAVSADKKYFDVLGADGIINTRAVIEAPPGHVLVGADYAAIELRMYAVASGDALLLDAIFTGKDPHALNFATMQSTRPDLRQQFYDKVMKSPAAVKKYFRNIAKRFAFLVIYGGQKDKLYQTMAADRNPDGTRSFPDLKMRDVDVWFDNWHKTHPETRQWHEAVVRAWMTYGFVATIIDGRKRFFIGGIDKTAMPNMTIQGSAASIANRAMIAIAKECPHRGWSPVSGPVLQVHDFIGLQVPEKRQRDAEDLLNATMPYTHAGMRFDIELKSGKRWDQT